MLHRIGNAIEWTWTPSLIISMNERFLRHINRDNIPIYSVAPPSLISRGPGSVDANGHCLQYDPQHSVPNPVDLLERRG